MLGFFWEIGRDLTKIRREYAWGSHFFEQISKDLKGLLPEVKSFSPRNLQYMCQFYNLYPELQIANQLDAQFEKTEITNQFDSRIILSIPWGHHKVIMSKCKGDKQKAQFYIQKVIENNWSRAVLLNFIDTYVAAVDGILRKPGDNPTIGLLICKTKDDVLAQYAVNSMKLPVGISEYELSKFMPAEFKNTLPTVEEIENELK